MARLRIAARGRTSGDDEKGGEDEDDDGAAVELDEYSKRNVSFNISVYNIV